MINTGPTPSAHARHFDQVTTSQAQLGGGGHSRLLRYGDVRQGRIAMQMVAMKLCNILGNCIVPPRHT